MPLTPNVMGIFAHNGKLFIDVADDRGAGSGEGHLTRFATTGDGTWKVEGCYYYGVATGTGAFDPPYNPLGLEVLRADECLY